MSPNESDATQDADLFGAMQLTSPAPDIGTPSHTQYGDFGNGATRATPSFHSRSPSMTPQLLLLSDSENESSDQEYDTAYQRLYAACGFKSEGIRPTQVQVIELVLDDCSRMSPIAYFPNLRRLTLISQDIHKIEGLSRCVQLEYLCLNENNITHIQELNACRRLKELYIAFNCLKEISNIHHLQELEVLWFGHNIVTRLAAAELPESLRDINASANKIESLGEQFPMPNLEVFSLAGNKLCDFRDIFHLQCPNLRELHLSDGDWGTNPVTTMRNYNTFFLFHLPRSIEIMDQNKLDKNAHNEAESTLLKKRLFYNMRVKTLKQHCIDALRTCQSLKEERRTNLLVRYEEIRMHVKGLQAFRASNPAGLHNVEFRKEFELKLSLLEQMTREQSGDIDDTMTIFDKDITQRILRLQDFHVMANMLEMETGGNIRFEEAQEGGTHPPWYVAAGTLVRARFDPQHFAEFGVSGINIRNVVKIHHEFSKAKIQDATRDAEHLFFLAKSEDDYDQAALQFISGQQSHKFPLTNSIGMHGVPALRHFISTHVGDAWENLSTRSKTMVPYPICRVLVCSAIVDGASEDRIPGTSVPLTFPLPRNPYAIWQSSPPSPLSDIDDGAEGMTFRREAREGCAGARSSSVPKARGDYGRVGGNAILWCADSRACCVPEYLVEFEYELEVRPGYDAVNWNSDFKEVYSQCVHSAKMITNIEIESNFDEVVRLGPILQDPPIIDKLTLTNMVAPSANGTLEPISTMALPKIQVLNLHGCHLRRFDMHVLEPLTNLTMLLLSFNQIETLSAIPRLLTVTTLDISYNLIQRVDSFGGFPQLSEVDFSGNELSRVDDVTNLCADLRSLVKLSLRGNPVMDIAEVATLNYIVHTYGVRYLNEVDVKSAQPPEDLGCCEINDDILMKAACTNTNGPSASSTGQPWGMSSVPWIQAVTPSRPVPHNGFNAEETQGQIGWKSKVMCLELPNRRLETADFLPQFLRIRRLNLSGNQLTSLEGLKTLMQLEDLNVENNCLQVLRGLCCASTLRRLDAGSNRITDIPEISAYYNLMSLSVEDNYIDSLDGFGALEGLVELYLSNNLIEDQRSVLMLKHLKRLVILDLTGNQFRSSEYRLYTIFHLHLEVLDGIHITSSKSEEARDKFSGKLTMELLEEKLGPAVACFNVRVVDLSNCKLREIGALLNDETFPSLRELVLDNNLLDSISTLGPLSRLQILRLNRTKLDPNNLAGDGLETGLRSLYHIQVLELGGNNIADISGLSAYPMSALRVLHLAGNDITKIEGLCHLDQLRELVLDRNKIRGFEEHSFTGLKSLRELHLEDNCVRMLTNLGPLPKLRALYLALNRINESQELDNLAELRCLVQVGIAQNPVARKPFYRVLLLRTVPSLRIIDGKEIVDEEREKASNHFAIDAHGMPVYMVPTDPTVLHREEIFGTTVVGSAYLDNHAHGGLDKPKLKVTSLSFSSESTQHNAQQSSARVTSKSRDQRPVSAGWGANERPVSSRELISSKRIIATPRSGASRAAQTKYSTSNPTTEERPPRPAMGGQPPVPPHRRKMVPSRRMVPMAVAAKLASYGAQE
eukprot:GEMP01001381.1.p1 GENE.GEMP01001381.1~~GEMP01001381.1.p1  ORF type:complete len:1576 (+),score=324.31 GEMP01001381.1:1-4728(+)